jgi:NAD(P)H dehydrogenase (quinone)
MMAGEQQGRHTCTLSGPQSLIKMAMAEQVSAAIGKLITVAQIPFEALVQGMVGAGFPERAGPRVCLLRHQHRCWPCGKRD